jgi:hypothetical protein
LGEVLVARGSQEAAAHIRACPSPAWPPQCFRVIYTYMAFAVFDIYFIITSLVSLQVLKVRFASVACRLACSA